MFNYLKALPQYILPKHGLTTLAGCLANVKNKAIKNALINRFIHAYGVDMSIACEEDPTRYENFNAFFIRHIKPEARPISTAAIISPVDGTLSEFGAINDGTIIQAKGCEYTVQSLLACDAALSRTFHDGCFATFYLSPKDYHRVHMPIEATRKEMHFIPGKLFSVQPSTVRNIPRLFARNERLVVFFDTAIGPMAMVLVGAVIVGSIGTCWDGDIVRKRVPITFPTSKDSRIPLKKASEMGYFKLGSTVILLFADKTRMRWQENLTVGADIKFGEALADLSIM